MFFWNKTPIAFGDSHRSQASGHCPARPSSWLGPAALALLSASGVLSPAHPQDTPAALAGLRSSTPAMGSGSAAPGNDSDSE